MDYWVCSTDLVAITEQIGSNRNVIGPKLSNGVYYTCIRTNKFLTLKTNVSFCDEKTTSSILGKWSEKKVTPSFIGVNVGYLANSISNIDWLALIEDGLIEYFIRKGVTLFRVPIKWDYLQPTLNGDLYQYNVSKLRQAVTKITSLGGVAIIDIHSYGKWGGVRIGGDGGPTQSNFIDLWTRVAKEFYNSQNVWFDLMNEPYTQTATEMGVLAQAAINAVRTEGFKGYILVEGGGSYSSAPAFVTSGWADVALTLTDTLNKIIFSPHCYLDYDCSGTGTTIKYVGIGEQRLTPPTEWARINGKKLILGEIGWADNTESNEEGHRTFQYLRDNSDVWIGVTYWATGVGWGDYMYLAKDGSGQMNVLLAFT